MHTYHMSRANRMGGESSEAFCLGFVSISPDVVTISEIEMDNPTHRVLNGGDSATTQSIKLYVQLASSNTSGQ